MKYISPHNKALVTMREDTDAPILYRQEVGYTDFPAGVFEWYVVDRVMLLKSEY